MLGKLLQAGFRPARQLDDTDTVHSCFFSEEVFRGAL